MLNLKVVCLSTGLWAAVSFVTCVIWGLVMPASAHMHELLELVLPVFEWLSWTGFMLGLIESFLFGVYVGLVFVPIYNYVKTLQRSSERRAKP